MVRRKKVRRFAVPGTDELQKLAGQVRNVRAIGRDAPPSVKQMETVGALIKILRERAEGEEQYLPILHAALEEQKRLRRYPRETWTIVAPKAKVPTLGASAPVGSGYRFGSTLTSARREVRGGLPSSKR